MFKVECPGCKAPYQVDERRVPATGLQMRCPKCGSSFKVEAPGAAGAPEAVGGAAGAAPRPALKKQPAMKGTMLGVAVPPGLLAKATADAPAEDVGLPVVNADGPAAGADLPSPAKAGVPRPRGGTLAANTIPRPMAPSAPASPSVDPFAVRAPSIMPHPLPSPKKGGTLPGRTAPGADIPLPTVGGDAADPFAAAPFAAPGAADLPAPVVPAVAPLPGPAVKGGTLPGRAPLPVVDDSAGLPSPVGADAGGADLPVFTGGIDLPSPAGGLPRPDEADLPAVGGAGTADDPEVFGADLPSPAGADLPSLGGIDLPPPGGAALPSLGGIDLPTPGGASLPSPGGVGLPSPGGVGLPSPGGAALPLPGGAGLPAAAADLPSPGAGLPAASDGFGELEAPGGGVFDEVSAEGDPFASPAAEVDPFTSQAAEADPFGAPPAQGSDPFGAPPPGHGIGAAEAAEDPFGAPPAEADPFGGDDAAADPFGGVAASDAGGFGQGEAADLAIRLERIPSGRHQAMAMRRPRQSPADSDRPNQSAMPLAPVTKMTDSAVTTAVASASRTKMTLSVRLTVKASVAILKRLILQEVAPVTARSISAAVRIAKMTLSVPSLANHLRRRLTQAPWSLAGSLKKRTTTARKSRDRRWSCKCRPRQASVFPKRNTRKADVASGSALRSS